MESAVTLFILFATCAIIPVIPIFFVGGFQSIIVCTIFSGFRLFLIGAQRLFWMDRPN